MPENPLRHLLLWGCRTEIAVLLALCAVVLFMVMNIFFPYLFSTLLELTATTIASTNITLPAVLITSPSTLSLNDVIQTATALSQNLMSTFQAQTSASAQVYATTRMLHLTPSPYPSRIIYTTLTPTTTP